MEVSHYWTQSISGITLTLAEYKGSIIACMFGSKARAVKEILDEYLPETVLKREKASLLSALKQLEEYFAGSRKEFHLPVTLYGTDFQRKVWGQLKRIPYGETVSYLHIARALGDKNLVRAVGGANHVNPVSIIVP
ncbi:MAG TPA: methylated-DNA--[protein]-cysteine S-methyltransferase, partial [Candidatus Kapabacteria bacterium]|nr:methylated-DNA--[protein]-cysteine S-methyltransferase [Candidatus Kapabacteria bacterium]